jgi:hypothetical protein
MSELIRCPTCGGRKRIIKLGGMSGKCDKCSGIGWIDEKSEKVIAAVKDMAKDVARETSELSKDKKDETSSNESVSSEKIVKRRGRPAKVKEVSEDNSEKTEG